MAPREVEILQASGVLDEHDAETTDGDLFEPAKKTAKPRQYEYVWRNIILMSLLHLMALYGGYLCFTGHAMWQTVVFGEH
jgi:hypothetical protein